MKKPDYITQMEKAATETLWEILKELDQETTTIVVDVNETEGE